METLFEKLLLEKIAHLRDIEIELITISGVSRMEDYTYHLGMIAGLKRIEDICDEIREEMNR
jgi:hypothetical protein